MAQHQNHHFFRIQQRAYAYRQRIFRHTVYVAVKKREFMRSIMELTF